MESNTWWARLPADDFVGISGRCERPLFGFVFDDEAIDSGLQADERHKDGAPFREEGHRGAPGQALLANAECRFLNWLNVNVA